MIIAFAGATARIDSSHAARLCAHAVHAAGMDVTLVRAWSQDTTAGPYAANLRVVMVPADADRVAAAILDAAAARARNGDRTVIADLPYELLVEPGIRDIVDLPVLTVGPYTSDERAAIARLARLRPAGNGNPGNPGTEPWDRLPWLLGCRRGGGGPAASAFAVAMADASANAGADGVRILPVAMGPLTRSEDTALDAGLPARRNLRDGTLLALALGKAFADPRAAEFTHPGLDAATESDRIVATADERSLPERLRDLADDIDAIVRSGGPSEADLANAPVLDHWIRDVVPTQVLKGFVSNHPGIATGRPVRTTEVFATDDATYARTLSRYYVLRMPGVPGKPTSLQ